MFAALQEIVDELSAGNLHALVESGASGLTRAELATALGEYPGRVTTQTIDSERANIIGYANDPRAGMLEYRLETDGAPDDLTVSCEYRMDGPTLVRIENIHVL
ncbi:hypothetical protein ACIGCK_14545 [Microbacterium sp. NPDC078428]|uniref:hypothetical protein n=1 Tax=Microbacterium sp. NPDC078428 TaxID=3364190 RepID=UPI0037CAA4B9